MFKDSAFRDGLYGTSFGATLRLYLVGTFLFTLLIVIAKGAIGFLTNRPFQMGVSEQVGALATVLAFLPVALAGERRLEDWLRSRFRPGQAKMIPLKWEPSQPPILLDGQPRGRK